MLPLELNWHTSRAIPVRTVLFRALSRPQPLFDGADFRQSQLQFPLFHRAFADFWPSGTTIILPRFHVAYGPQVIRSSHVGARRRWAKASAASGDETDKARCSDRNEIAATPQRGFCQSVIRSSSIIII
jgi:hypothetical protein